ncbi:uncharacterized protein LOC119870416 [Canis lupus familiaris]|uniref:uncharacterized protein LOC118353400 n=1 Tax=Canis lupus dingo TaxID=286419 RepID=UPI0018F61087|nr:uncharacterized protein LOC118353400 [Canis lupus dingo]XP_038318932.1 uncharacterized protein LOC119870416 [Canis lupus familiaris]
MQRNPRCPPTLTPYPTLAGARPGPRGALPPRTPRRPPAEAATSPATRVTSRGREADGCHGDTWASLPLGRSAHSDPASGSTGTITRRREGSRGGYTSPAPTSFHAYCRFNSHFRSRGENPAPARGQRSAVPGRHAELRFPEGITTLNPISQRPQPTWLSDRSQRPVFSKCWRNLGGVVSAFCSGHCVVSSSVSRSSGARRRVASVSLAQEDPVEVGRVSVCGSPGTSELWTPALG